MDIIKLTGLAFIIFAVIWVAVVVIVDFCFKLNKPKRDKFYGGWYAFGMCTTLTFITMFIVEVIIWLSQSLNI